MTVVDTFGLLSQGVLAASAVLAAAFRVSGDRLSPGTPTAVALWGGLVALSIAVRVGGLPLAAYPRGLIGDPSVVSVALLVLAVLRPAALPPAPRPRVALAIALSAALLLYLPLVTGTLPFGIDVYALGWRATPLLAVLGALGAFAWIRGEDRWVAVVSVGLLAWGAGLVESDNLFDALVDPGLVLACAACASRRR